MISLAPTKTFLKGQLFFWYESSLASGQGRNHTGGGYDNPTSTLFGSDVGVDALAYSDGLDASRSSAR
jgi:hypothetical protein